MTAEQPIWYRDQLSDRASFRMMHLHELEERVGNTFWKSPDIAIAQPVLLLPGQSKFTPINFPANLQLFDNLPVDLITYMATSTRSRFAQIGLEVHGAGQLIAESLEDEKYKIGGTPYPATVMLRNHSQRPIEIDKNTPLFRLYSSTYLAHPPLRVQGDSLLLLLANGDIELTGEKGHDWDIAYYQYESRQGGPAGLMLRIDKSSRRWIEPDTAPIKIPEGKDKDYRVLIDSILRPVPAFSERVHWVGETTSEVTLAPSVNGIIESHTATSPGLSGMVDGMDHLASPLIDAGFSNTIRTEIVSPTDKSAPDFIILYVFKDL